VPISKISWTALNPELAKAKVDLANGE